MISGVSGASSASLLTLLSTQPKAEPAPSKTSSNLPTVHGGVSLAFKAANAIGTIIALVAQQDQSKSANDKVFTMEGATWDKKANGDSIETKTGKGLGVSDEDYWKASIANARKVASGTEPVTYERDIENARLAVKAWDEGRYTIRDVSDEIVSTMTVTNFHGANGSFGTMTTYKTTGNDEFREKYTYIDENSVMRDKATGERAGIGQNGTKWIYMTWGD